MKNDMGIFRSLALVTQLGLSMALPVIFGVIVGKYLDERLGTGHILLIVFSIIGVLASFRNLYHLAYKSTKRK